MCTGGTDIGLGVGGGVKTKAGRSGTGAGILGGTGMGGIGGGGACARTGGGATVAAGCTTGAGGITRGGIGGDEVGNPAGVDGV